MITSRDRSFCARALALVRAALRVHARVACKIPLAHDVLKAENHVSDAKQIAPHGFPQIGGPSYSLC